MSSPDKIIVQNKTDPFLQSLYVLGNSDGDLTFDEARGQTIELPYPTLVSLDNYDTQLADGTKSFSITTTENFETLRSFLFRFTVRLPLDHKLTESEIAFLARYQTRIIILENFDAKMLAVESFNFIDSSDAPRLSLSLFNKPAASEAVVNNDAENGQPLTELNGFVQKWTQICIRDAFQISFARLQNGLSSLSENALNILDDNQKHMNGSSVQIEPDWNDAISKAYYNMGNSDGDFDIMEFAAYHAYADPSRDTRKTKKELADEAMKDYPAFNRSFKAYRQTLSRSPDSFTTRKDQFRLWSECQKSKGMIISGSRSFLVYEAGVKDDQLLFNLYNPQTQNIEGALVFDEDPRKSFVYFVGDTLRTRLSTLLDDEPINIDALMDLYWGVQYGVPPHLRQLWRSNYEVVQNYDWQKNLMKAASYVEQPESAIIFGQGVPQEDLDKINSWYSNMAVSIGDVDVKMYADAVLGEEDKEGVDYQELANMISESVPEDIKDYFSCEDNPFLQNDEAHKISVVISGDKRFSLGEAALYVFALKALFINLYDLEELLTKPKSRQTLRHEMMHAWCDLISQQNGDAIETTGVIADEFNRLVEICEQQELSEVPTVMPYGLDGPYELAAVTLLAFFVEDAAQDLELNWDPLHGPADKEELWQKNPRLYLAYEVFTAKDSPARFDPWIFTDDALPFIDEALMVSETEDGSYDQDFAVFYLLTCYEEAQSKL